MVRKSEARKTMDPEATLTALRGQVRAVMAAEDTPGIEHDYQDQAIAMADLFSALDGWLSTGGFLPAAWVQTRTEP